MKKLLLIYTLIISISVLGLFAQEEGQRKSRPTQEEGQRKSRPVEESPKAAPQTQKAAAFKADIAGTVISIAKLAKGENPAVTKAEAEELAKNGQILALKVDDKIYFVYNTKHVFDGKGLARYAGDKKLGIEGELKQVNGFDVVIAKRMKNVD